MQISSQNQVVVDITAVEIQEWVSSHMNVLTPQDAVVTMGAGPNAPTKFIGLTFGATREQIDNFLRPLIPDLPPVGSYTFWLVQNKANQNFGGARISWTK